MVALGSIHLNQEGTGVKRGMRDGWSRFLTSISVGYFFIFKVRNTYQEIAVIVRPAYGPLGRVVRSRV
jgi:hypothetical protein